MTDRPVEVRLTLAEAESLVASLAWLEHVAVARRPPWMLVLIAAGREIEAALEVVQRTTEVRE